MFRSVSIRWLIPIAVLMFALVVAACDDGGDDGDDADAGDTDETEEVTEETDGSADGEEEMTEEEDDAASEDEEASDEEMTEEEDAEATEDDAATAEESDDESDSEESEGETSGVAPGESDWDEPIVFADNDWESALALNRVAQFILEEGYGYETDAIFGTTIPLFQGQLNNEIQVNMEIWPAQTEGWEGALEDGALHDLGASFDESVQGWYIPTYMIEGDEERGIEPVAPDLTHVDDLPDHWELFEDPEDESKGRFMAGIAGWEAERVNEVKFNVYGLDEYYNFFLPGSAVALNTSIVTAYEAGEPWFGYYWGPTWIFGQYDMTMLDEPEYTDECWQGIQDAIEGGDLPDEACAYPAPPVHIGVTDDFYQSAPDAVELLENFELTMEEVSEILAHMFEEDVEAEDGALWFLNERSEIWHDWVPEEVIEDIEAALE